MFAELPASARAFYNSIMVESLNALKLNTFFDNFDAQRFNFDGVDRSKQFNSGDHAFHFEWFIRNVENLFGAYSLLGDEESKRLYLHLIAFRLAGHFSVRLPVAFAGKSDELAEYTAVAHSTPSQLASGGLFGGLKHFDFNYKNEHYVVDCLGLEYYLVRRQYFFDRGGIRIAPVAGDVVIDGGACVGDTAAVFSNAVGVEGRVFCFDPVADHIAILGYNAKQFPVANVQVMPYGLSDQNVAADPIVLNHYAPGFSSVNQTVPLRSIDNMVHTKELPKLNFVKLDVEGAELASLKGARESIRRFKPKLAVSLYHKPNDMFEIIGFVKENFPFYSMHIDHYTIHAEETVLYCNP